MSQSEIFSSKGIDQKQENLSPWAMMTTHSFHFTDTDFNTSAQGMAALSLLSFLLKMASPNMRVAARHPISLLRFFQHRIYFIFPLENNS
jgi:hypothetical protein